MLEVVLNEKEQKSLHIWLKFQTSLIYFSSRINSLKETIHFRMHRIEGQPTYSLKSLITFFVSKKKKSKRLLSLLATVNLHFFLIPLNKWLNCMKNLVVFSTSSPLPSRPFVLPLFAALPLHVFPSHSTNTPSIMMILMKQRKGSTTQTTKHFFQHHTFDNDKTQRTQTSRLCHRLPFEMFK